MSVLDQLRALEQQAEKRLRELAPLVAEYRDLQKVAERLGLKRDAPEASDPAAAKPPAKAKAKGTPKASRQRTRTTPATESRAPRRKATTPTPESAPADAVTGMASAPKRSPATASRRAKSKPKAKPAAATRAVNPTTRTRRNAAAPGQRQQDVLRLVNERPGITVAELAQQVSVDATGLYGIVRRLQTNGQITKDGTGLRPLTERPSTDPTPATTPAEPKAGAPSTTPESAAPPPKAPATRP